MLAQAAKCGGFKFDAGLVVHGMSSLLFGHVSGRTIPVR
jgi:hypothetical protein